MGLLYLILISCLLGSCDIQLCWKYWFGTPTSLEYSVCAMHNAELAYVCVCVCVCAHVHVCVCPLTHCCLFNIQNVYGQIFYYDAEILTQIYGFHLLSAVFFHVWSRIASIYSVMQQNSENENEMRNPHLSAINYLASNCMEMKPKILISMIICE